MINHTVKKLFLARHGESIANQQKLISGQLDSGLSEKGLLQAQWLCDVLKDELISAIYTSTLVRTIETAKPTAKHHALDIQPEDNFKEMNFGKLQGCAHNQSDYLTHFSNRQPPANLIAKPCSTGENLNQFTSRVEKTLTHVLQNLSGSTLIVGHRKTNEVILANLLKVNINEPPDRPINIKNKYLYEIELSAKAVIHTIRLGGEFHGRRYAGFKDD